MCVCMPYIHEYESESHNNTDVLSNASLGAFFASLLYFLSHTCTHTHNNLEAKIYSLK